MQAKKYQKEYSDYLHGKEPKTKAKAKKIAFQIWDDINGRSGYDLGSLDDDIQEEILDKWIKIAEES